MHAEGRTAGPALGVQSVLRKCASSDRVQKAKDPHSCPCLVNTFIGSERTGLWRAGTGTERRGAARGFAPEWTCCVGAAGGLPGPPRQQRLGPWHLAPGVTSAGLARWPPRRRAPPFSSCRSCESFTVRRGGVPGWAPPRGAGRPRPPVHPGLSAAAAG